MGDDYTGPVTVSADDGSEHVLGDGSDESSIEVWSQSGTIREMIKGQSAPAPPASCVFFNSTTRVDLVWCRGCQRVAARAAIISEYPGYVWASQTANPATRSLSRVWTRRR